MGAIVAVIVIAGKPVENKQLITSPAGIRVASITPAGTDLVIGIGAGDRLVGISNYDDDREGTAGKPRIGDYQNIDWEKLSGLGANVLLLQYAPDRLPAFIQQRCNEMGIKIVNLKLDTVDEICKAMETLGDAIGNADQGKKAADDLRAKLTAVADSVKALPREKAIVVTSDQEGFGLAGPGEFLSEILQIAGGENAADSLGKPYPNVDRETITSLAPDVVIRLVPDGDLKPQVVQSGDRIWRGMTEVPAVRNHRVFVVTDWYAEEPGFRVGDLAEKFAELLHPRLATTRPADFSRQVLPSTASAEHP
jgi:ABC-type Fe3+-hydroxamate transport system substrate-binding protein